MFRKQIKQIINKASTNSYETLNSVELSKSRLLRNVDYFKKKHANQVLIPVLKANAYGHGLVQIAEMLNDTDCGYLAVDGYFEAAKIRDVTKHPILVLGYIKPSNIKLLDTKKCSFVVQDIDGLRALSLLNRPVKVHIELNTGMNRLGLQPEELVGYLKLLKNSKYLHLDGVMSHLADADNNSNEYTNQQVKLFDKLVEQILRDGFTPKYIHIAQTAGSTKAKSKFANTVRIGIGLYGVNPLNQKDKHFEDLSALSPVLELKSTIIKVIGLHAGDRVSYNGIFTAPKEMRIGVLPLGYYEGIPRELSNKGIMTSGKIEFPIVGRVCMNHTIIDLKTSDLRVGDKVTVISSNPSNPNSIEQICESNNLFNYSLMTGISESTRRVIVP